MNRLTGMMFALAMAMALLLPVFTGCGGKPPATATPAEQDLPQILDDAVLAVQNAGTYKFAIDTNTGFTANAGSDVEDMNAAMKITGIANVDDSEIQIIYDMVINGYMFEYQEGITGFHGEVYVLPDWTYQKTDIPDNDQWTKMPSDVSYDQYNVVVNELALLQSPEKIEFVESENFDGSACYVLKLTANPEQTEAWFNEHQMTADIIYWEEVEPYVGELAFTLWVDQDTSLIKKMDAVLLIDFDDLADVPDFDTMTMNVLMEMTDYNESASIVLPDEAKNAQEAT
jgi:hypothetical protein